MGNTRNTKNKLDTKKEISFPRGRCNAAEKQSSLPCKTPGLNTMGMTSGDCLGILRLMTQATWHACPMARLPHLQNCPTVLDFLRNANQLSLLTTKNLQNQTPSKSHCDGALRPRWSSNLPGFGGPLSGPPGGLKNIDQRGDTDCSRARGPVECCNTHECIAACMLKGALTKGLLLSQHRCGSWLHSGRQRGRRCRLHGQAGSLRQHELRAST